MLRVVVVVEVAAVPAVVVVVVAVVIVVVVVTVVVVIIVLVVVAAGKMEDMLWLVLAMVGGKESVQCGTITHTKWKRAAMSIISNIEVTRTM